MLHVSLVALLVVLITLWFFFRASLSHLALDGLEGGGGLSRFLGLSWLRAFRYGSNLSYAHPRYSFEESAPPSSITSSLIRAIRAAVEDEGWDTPSTLLAVHHLNTHTASYANIDDESSAITQEDVAFLFRLVGRSELRCTGFTASTLHEYGPSSTPHEYGPSSTPHEYGPSSSMEDAVVHGTLHSLDHLIRCTRVIDIVANERFFAWDLFFHAGGVCGGARVHGDAHGAVAILIKMLDHSSEAYMRVWAAATAFMHVKDEVHFLHTMLHPRASHGDAAKLVGALLQSPHGPAHMVDALACHVSRSVGTRGGELSSIATSIARAQHHIDHSHHSVDPLPTPSPHRACPSDRFNAQQHYHTHLLHCVWECTPCTFPIDMPCYTTQQHNERVRRIRQLQSQLHSTCPPPRARELHRRIAAMSLGLPPSFFETIKEFGFLRETRHFVEEAQQSGLDPEEVKQAVKNVWTCYGMQMVLFGEPVCTPPAFRAFSLLYPYTDNYLDDLKTPHHDKLAFQSRFHTRITGTPVDAKGKQEDRIFRLVNDVERQYARETYPDVFNSMLAMNDAQTASLRQMTEDVPSTSTLLELSCRKGGASVLTDAYLVHGRLERDEALFAFALGCGLQLVDDLADVLDDSALGQHTFFTRLFAERACGDRWARKLLGFLAAVVDPKLGLCPGVGPRSTLLHQWVRGLVSVLLLKAMAKRAFLFTESFLDELQQRCPLPLETLQRVAGTNALITLLSKDRI